MNSNTNENDCYPPECDLIPAWFSERMMTDVWCFGVLLTTGQALAVECIESITQDASGALWIDFTLLQEKNVSLGDRCSFARLVYSPTSRTTISVNAAQVVAAFELADT